MIRVDVVSVTVTNVIVIDVACWCCVDSLIFPTFLKFFFLVWRTVEYGLLL